MAAVATLEKQSTQTAGASEAAKSVIGEPLPEFDTVGGTAYSRADDKNAYVIVQNRNVPFRKNMIDAYNRVKASALSDLREAKVLHTPNGKAACFTMQRPRGGMVFIGKPIGDKVLRNLILPSILAVFKSLHDEGMSYRYLSPDRIYYKTETQDEILLLESFSVPAGLEHPLSYETIGRSMVDPVARGEGTFEEDYYALGVLIAHLMMGRDPRGGRSEQSFQQARMSQGSFSAVVSGSSITGAVSALLRGLLQDDPELRWGYKDVTNWLNGELRSAAPGHGTWVMSQPISFSGRTITDKRALAAALQANPDAADSLIKRQTATQWVGQIAAGSEAHQALVNLLEHGSTTKRVDASANAQDAALARFCSLLDPTGPIRYRNIMLMPDALGPYFASSYLQNDKEKLGSLQSLMSGNIWHGLMDIRALMAGPESQLEQMNSRVSWLKDARQINDGLERALYALNEGLPCHSPEVGDAWVTTPMQAMLALDNRCLASTEGINLDDSDLLAFLAARAPSIRDKALSIKRASQEARDIVHLRLYGELHLVYGSRPLKGLSRLFQVRFKSRVNQLKGKSRRDLLRQKIAEAADAGNLNKLAKLMNIERLKAMDESGYMQAKMKIRKIDKAIAFASRSISANDPTAIAKSAQVTCYLGGFLLLGSVLLRIL